MRVPSLAAGVGFYVSVDDLEAGLLAVSMICHRHFPNRAKMDFCGVKLEAMNSSDVPSEH